MHHEYSYNMVSKCSDKNTLKFPSPANYIDKG